MSSPQVLSGKLPFDDCRVDATVLRAVIERRRPPMEPLKSVSGASYQALWGAAERAWAHEPGDRPSIDELLPSIQPLEATTTTTQAPPPEEPSTSLTQRLESDWSPLASPDSFTPPSSASLLSLISFKGSDPDLYEALPTPVPKYTSPWSPLRGKTLRRAYPSPGSSLGNSVLSKEFTPIQQLLPCVAALRAVSNSDS